MMMMETGDHTSPAAEAARVTHIGNSNDPIPLEGITLLAQGAEAVSVGVPVFCMAWLSVIVAMHRT